MCLVRTMLEEFENAFNHRPFCIGVWVKLGQGNVTDLEKLRFQNLFRPYLNAMLAF